MRLPDWFPGVRWNRRHDEAWAPELVQDEEGFTVFAREAESSIVRKLHELGAKVDERIVEEGKGFEGRRELFVTLSVKQPSITVYIQRDQVDVVGPGVEVRVEQWDALTPRVARNKALAGLERCFNRVPA
jgi:hypothetical protein